MFRKLIEFIQSRIQVHTEKPEQDQEPATSVSESHDRLNPPIMLKLRALLDEKTDPEKESHVCPECGGELFISHTASNSLSGRRWGIAIQCKNCKDAGHMSLAGDSIPRWLEDDKG